MENLSNLVFITFGITVVISIWLLFKASAYSKNVLVISLIWIILQSILGISEFYTNFDTIPPRLFFMISPPLFLIIYLLLKRKEYLINQFDLKTLTILHVIRIPVEICLFELYKEKLIPELMTFEGLNFDIFSGISSLLIFIIAFRNNSVNKKLLLVWNVICLLLVINIVSIGILSAKTPFQQLSFEQPNIGIAYFPFNLLPAFIVPLVIFSHIVSILQLRKNSK